MDQGPGGIVVGDAVIRRIHERDFSMGARELFPDWTPDDAGPDGMAAGELTLSVHAWLVRVEDRVVLVDAGIGNGKRRASNLFDRLETPFLDRLAEAGVAPEQVTDVLLTHLHVDHVGWCTTGGDGHWRPTFPNARHVMPRAGCAFFQTAEGRAHPNAGMFEDSIRPVIDAGLASFVEAEGGAVGHGFVYHPTPGHSPDHASIAFDRGSGRGSGLGSGRALFSGDVFHHPMQLRRPDLSSMFCADPEEARRSREWALNRAADEDRVVFSSHVEGPSVGRVRRDGRAYRWEAEGG